MFLILTLCFLVTTPNYALTALLKGNDEECFFEETQSGERVHGSYAVTAGEIDLTVSIYDPEDKPILKLLESRQDSFSFVTLQEGFYTICFLNNKNEISTVDFNMHYGDSLKIKNLVQEDHITPIEQSVNELQEGIDELNSQIRYHQHRLTRHKKTTESTQSRLSMWTFIESGCLITVSLVQTYIIRSFFENKRKV